MQRRLRLGLANTLAAIGQSRAAWRFYAALREPGAAQQRRLAAILARNAGSAFGRQHGFDRVRTPDDYHSAVPVGDHASLSSWLERAYHGEPGVLTREPILMFEKTSGSAGKAKYIPYTATLRSEFQAAASAWLFDLWRNRPGLRSGSAYWSVSPAAREPETTPGGHPVGFADDTEYFDPLARWVLRQILAVPGDVAHLPDMASVRRATIDHLVGDRHLALISVWNPTFLTLLADAVEERLGRFSHRELWPRLDLISCWADAAAARFLPRVRERFPGVAIQGKGLLSTEGVVSIPLCARPEGCAPALTSHYLEFTASGGNRPLRVHELEIGQRYGVLLTTGGGLYRHATHDLVTVAGRIGPTPLLTFAGKADLVSDLCGEKVHATHVEVILADLVPGACFAMLAPEDGAPPRYVLFVEGSTPDAADLDARLRENPHYAYCRDLGQLGPAEVVAVMDGPKRYLAGCEALGQKAGNVKPAALHRATGWAARFGAAVRSRS